MKPVVILMIVGVLLVLLCVYKNTMEGFENVSKSVVILKADWCGHCKQAAPEFEKLVAASPITLKDGSKASVKILDADKDKSEISNYKVKGFPTILIMNGADTIEYPGERTSDGVIDFLNQ